jgi:uncharacterized repeat protein (TIGR02059 family)
MATPVNVVSSGGVAVTEASVGGTPITEGLPGRGTPVTIVASGGFPVVFVDADPPEANTAEVTNGGDNIVITFTDLLDETSVPDVGDFVVTANGLSAGAISLVVVSGDTVTLTMAAPLTPGDDILVTYTPGSDPLKGLTGVDVPAFTDLPATNP